MKEFFLNLLPTINGFIGKFLFWDVAFWDNGAEGELQIPFIVLWLTLGALYFTLKFQFLNIRAFVHATHCVRGFYSHPDERGEISHFQALSAALSATVGLGNIAGVAVAVGLGGPGAVFWMVVAGFLGMSSKFAECTLGQKYRVVRDDGHVSGGPMHYLQDGLTELGLAHLGRVLAVMFAIMCIGGSLGGGNMFQANQSYKQMASVIPVLNNDSGAIFFGLLLAFGVGLVIVGGIKRIGQVAALLVPFMCGTYLICGSWILLVNAQNLVQGLGVIFSSAFSFEAGLGGFVGVIIQGFRRAAFSNEAGIGSASIAHSAASTEEPVREGIVALLEPFIDTIVVCTMTGLILVCTGAYSSPEAGEGISMTSYAFATVFPWFPTVLAIIAVLFAFSTMISWSYYGEQCWARLFGTRSIMFYKGIFLAFILWGSISELHNVIEFSDLMILGMAFPNIMGVVMLSGKIKVDLDEYLRRLKAGEFPEYLT